jgi:Fe-Mn family superoxide dismutase
LRVNQLRARLDAVAAKLLPMEPGAGREPGRAREEAMTWSPRSFLPSRSFAVRLGGGARGDRSGHPNQEDDPMTPQYRPQSFDLHGLSGISDAQLAEHFALYQGYVKQVNTLNEQLAAMLGRGQASGKSPEFAELTRRLGFEYNGMILHEYYFSNLRAGAEPRPRSGSGLAQALGEFFGGIEQWQEDFQAIGEMRGVGWVVLFQDPATDRLTNHWITLHQDGVPASFKPLLVMDVWEHAYMRDYKATERKQYIDAFFRNVCWETVERRLADQQAIRPAA